MYNTHGCLGTRCNLNKSMFLCRTNFKAIWHNSNQESSNDCSKEDDDDSNTSSARCARIDRTVSNCCRSYNAQIHGWPLRVKGNFTNIKVVRSFKYPEDESTDGEKHEANEQQNNVRIPDEQRSYNKQKIAWELMLLADTSVLQTVKRHVICQSYQEVDNSVHHYCDHHIWGVVGNINIGILAFIPIYCLHRYLVWCSMTRGSAIVWVDQQDEQLNQEIPRKEFR